MLKIPTIMLYIRALQKYKTCFKYKSSALVHFYPLKIKTKFNFPIFLIKVLKWVRCLVILSPKLPLFIIIIFDINQTE